MKFVLLVVYCAQLIYYCAGDSHTWGHRADYLNYRIYERTLIDDKNDVPKNYTLIYKYFGSYFKPIAYFEINIESESSGYVHHKHDTVSFHDRTYMIDCFDVKIDINHAKNVKATISMLGAGIGISMGWLGKASDTKSLTFIYVKNAAKIEKAFAQNSIGKRRKGDRLLHFESRNITNMSRFPSRSFAYSGKDLDQYITYVGFSFNSPTAMVMVNTSFIGEQEFNSVVYDMNTEHFVANMSVYGSQELTRPSGFEGVI